MLLDLVRETVLGVSPIINAELAMRSMEVAPARSWLSAAVLGWSILDGPAADWSSTLVFERASSIFVKEIFSEERSAVIRYHHHRRLSSIPLS